MIKKIHTEKQGSDEWLALRMTKRPASLIAAVMGLSPYTTRNEVLRVYATGIPVEIDSFVENFVFSEGHRVEPLARGIIENLIGEDLSPVVYSKGLLSASTDGINFAETVGFECKQWNEDLAGLVRDGIVPDSHMPQVQQCLLVTGAEEWYFTVSDGTEENTIYTAVKPSQEWFNRITSAWDQFEIDLANYAPVIHDERPVADAIKELPALFIHARGEITTNNMQDYGNALAARLKEVRAIVLVEDKDFANANKAAKDFREQIEKLRLVKSAMLEQTTTIGEAARMIDDWCEDLRVTALQLEKDVKREDLAKKEKIVSGGKLAYLEHLQALEAEIKPIELVIADKPDFSSAIARKRDYNSMQNGVDTLLANSKIAADAIAKDIRSKLAWIKESHPDYGFLFKDLQQIIYKATDDFELLVNSRVTDYKKAEDEKLEAQRLRIEAEAKRKAEAEQAEKLEAGREKIRQEEEAKLRAEQAEKDRVSLEAKQVDELAERERLELENQEILDLAVNKADSEKIIEAAVEKQSSVDHVDEKSLYNAKSYHQERPIKGGNITVEMITIPKSEYDNLLQRSEWLSCLEGAGVDNWDGIDHAQELLEEFQLA